MREWQYRLFGLKVPGSGFGVWRPALLSGIQGYRFTTPSGHSPQREATSPELLSVEPQQGMKDGFPLSK